MHRTYSWALRAPDTTHMGLGQEVCTRHTCELVRQGACRHAGVHPRGRRSKADMDTGTIGPSRWFASIPLKVYGQRHCTHKIFHCDGLLASVAEPGRGGAPVYCANYATFDPRYQIPEG